MSRGGVVERGGPYRDGKNRSRATYALQWGARWFPGESILWGSFTQRREDAKERQRETLSSDQLASRPSQGAVSRRMRRFLLTTKTPRAPRKGRFKGRDVGGAGSTIAAVFRALPDVLLLLTCHGMNSIPFPTLVQTARADLTRPSTCLSLEPLCLGGERKRPIRWRGRRRGGRSPASCPAGG